MEALDRSQGPGAIARKGIGIGMALFSAWSHLAYRLRPPWRGKLRFVDHITLPCCDLAVAEDFYVRLLGARVMFRLDEQTLRRWNRPADEIEKGVHLSLVFESGPRLDLFRSKIGQPPLEAGHPHLAFYVAPGRLLEWKQRLEASGVPTYGPTRLGPPGHASLYFNDPFGNHLELVTQGFVPEIPVGAPDMATLAYAWPAARSSAVRFDVHAVEGARVQTHAEMQARAEPLNQGSGARVGLAGVAALLRRALE